MRSNKLQRLIKTVWRAWMYEMAECNSVHSITPLPHLPTFAESQISLPECRDPQPN